MAENPLTKKVSEKAGGRKVGVMKESVKLAGIGCLITAIICGVGLIKGVDVAQLKIFTDILMWYLIAIGAIDAGFFLGNGMEHNAHGNK